MNSKLAAHESVPANNEYETPVLMLIGPATDVVLGLPGVGYDGPYGMSEAQFEFESDE